MDPSATMRVEEVAKLLRISYSTVYRLLKHKQIPAFRVGTDWRFNRPQIDQWMRDKGAYKQ